MPDSVHPHPEPRWLTPALQFLALLALASGLVAPSVAWLFLPLIGGIGWGMRGHGVRTTASWTLPLLLVLVVLTGLPTLSWVPSVSAVTGAGLVALMLLSRHAQIWWLSRLPSRWLGQPWIVRVEEAGFSKAIRRGNVILDAINAEGPTDRARRDVGALRAHAVRKRDRANVWRGAWGAFVAQLTTICEMLDADDPSEFAAVLEERRAALIAAERASAEVMRGHDPFGVSLSQPGVGLIEDSQGRPAVRPRRP